MFGEENSMLDILCSYEKFRKMTANVFFPLEKSKSTVQKQLFRFPVAPTQDNVKNKIC